MSEQIAAQERYDEAKAQITEIMKISAPYQSARDELAKTLISISSAAIVLTITFAKPFAVSSQSQVWRSLPYVSWAAFLVSIIASLITLFLSITVRGIGMRFFNERANIIRAIASPDRSLANAYQEAENLLQKITKPNKKDAWADVCVKISLVSFGLALIILGAIGWWQLS